MKIGEVARRTGLTPRAIRLYESAGIIPKLPRRDSGYRRFDEQDVRTLTLVRTARTLGFDLDAVGKLVALWREGATTEPCIEALLAERVAELRDREEALRAMRLRLEAAIAGARAGDAGGVLLETLLAANAELVPARGRPRAGADITAVRSRASADPCRRSSRRPRRTVRR